MTFVKLDTCKFIGLVLLVATISISAAESDNAYVISGKYFVSKFDRFVRLTDEQRTTTARVVVTYEQKNELGDSETVELIVGSFANNEIRLNGEIDEPTVVQISIHDGEDDISTTSALVVPGGEEIVFAYDRVVSRNSERTRVDLHGTARRSKDLSKRFTINGDFRSLEDKVPLARVKVRWQEHIDGDLKLRLLASVLTTDQTFLIEADVLEPTVAEIFVYSFTENLFVSFLDVVLAPNAQISVSVNKSGNDLIATATRGRHALLIDSWSQSDEYLNKSFARDEAFARYAKEEGLPKLTSTSNPTDTKNQEQATSRGIDGSDSKLRTAAEVDENKTVPEYKLLDADLDKIRTKALQNIAKSTKDPINALLAMELGAFTPESPNRDEAFPIYDKLTSSLDEDLVERRVSPMQADLRRNIEKWDNDK